MTESMSKQNNPNFQNGKAWSEEMRLKAGERMVKRLLNNGYNKTDTRCHLALEKLLTSCGLRVQKEVVFPPFIVDCYVDDIYVAFEADSKIWHSKKRDRARDASILEKYKLPIKRFLDTDLLRKSSAEQIKAEIEKFALEYSDSAIARKEFASSLEQVNFTNTYPYSSKIFYSKTESR